MQRISDRQRDDAQQAYRALERFINSMGHSKEAFVELFAKEHPTLQQQMFSLFMMCIYKMAEQARHADARNEGSTAKAQKIVDLLGPDGWAVRFI